MSLHTPGASTKRTCHPTKQTSPLKPRYIGTVADASKRWCVSEKTIRRMINAGELTGYYPTPRRLRVDLAELDQVMEARSTKWGA